MDLQFAVLLTQQQRSLKRRMNRVQSLQYPGDDLVQCQLFGQAEGEDGLKGAAQVPSGARYAQAVGDNMVHGAHVQGFDTAGQQHDTRVCCHAS